MVYRITLLLLVVVAAHVIAPSRAVRAQGTTGPAIRDSNVGYIDPAIPDDFYRFRYDTAYGNTRPTRAEFFWAPGAPAGGGPDVPERSVDYQDLMFYAERMFAPQTSAFVNVPVRFLNPELNPNTAGLVDISAGLKHAFIYEDDYVTSFQLRAFAPSGDFDRGLGNGHASLEPALLMYQKLGGGWCAEAELRDWIPLDGGDFAGNILSYGVGLHYDDLTVGGWQLVPITEFIGWTVLSGKVAVVDSNGLAVIEDAEGESIVHAKAGLRLKYNAHVDLYMGYGRPLTGDSWYQDTFRVEFRFSH